MSTKFKTSFIGILGKDAEFKQIGNHNYITMNVAKSEKQGQETLTDWLQCNKFAGNSPSNLMQYLKKGTKVLFYGKLDVREWTNQQGETKVQFTLWVDEMELISQPKQAGQQQPTTNNAQYQQPNKFTPPTSQPMEFTAPQEDDDLPF
jgi:single-strand DNA-binding protein